MTNAVPTQSDKAGVRNFWDIASCGEDLYLKGFTGDDYRTHSRIRYELEPEILEFGEFSRFAGKKTLEIGVGLGSDHQRLAEAGAVLNGVDLTPRAIGHTRRRFELLGLASKLQVADAEALPFADGEFDAVYSWGVLHHTPDTDKAVSEVFRVLKPGGFAKIMIYHKYALVGYMLWLRYALLRGRPWTSLDTIYDQYLESPGTKAYSVRQARELFRDFDVKSLRTHMTHADLLTSEAGQRHRGNMLRVAKALWPRALLKYALAGHGLELMIECEKPSAAPTEPRRESIMES